MAFLAAAFWILCVVALSALLARIWSRFLPPALYRTMLIPGVVLHELAHALGCLITFARIEKMNLFDADGGSVKHGPPRIPVFGPVIISFAPLIFGIIAVLLLNKFFGQCKVFVWLQMLLDIFYALFARSSSSHSVGVFLKITLYIYMLINIAITLSPSRQDVKNCVIAFVVILAAVIAVHSFAGPFSFLNAGAKYISDACVSTLRSLVGITVLSASFLGIKTALR